MITELPFDIFPLIIRTLDFESIFNFTSSFKRLYLRRENLFRTVKQQQFEKWQQELMSLRGEKSVTGYYQASEGWFIKPSFGGGRSIKRSELSKFRHWTSLFQDLVASFIEKQLWYFRYTDLSPDCRDEIHKWQRYFAIIDCDQNYLIVDLINWLWKLNKWYNIVPIQLDLDYDFGFHLFLFKKPFEAGLTSYLCRYLFKQNLRGPLRRIDFQIYSTRVATSMMDHEQHLTLLFKIRRSNPKIFYSKIKLLGMSAGQWTQLFETDVRRMIKDHNYFSDWPSFYSYYADAPIWLKQVNRRIPRVAVTLGYYQVASKLQSIKSF